MAANVTRARDDRTEVIERLEKQLAEVMAGIERHEASLRLRLGLKRMGNCKTENDSRCLAKIAPPNTTVRWPTDNLSHATHSPTR